MSQLDVLVSVDHPSMELKVKVPSGCTFEKLTELLSRELKQEVNDLKRYLYTAVKFCQAPVRFGSKPDEDVTQFVKNQSAIVMAAPPDIAPEVVPRRRKAAADGDEEEDKDDLIPLRTLFAALKANPSGALSIKQVCAQAGEAVVHEGFWQLKPESVRLLLQSDDFGADEEAIFDAAVMWGQAQCKRENKEVNPANTSAVLETHGILKLIRFPLMPMEALVNKVTKGQLLSNNQLLEIFTYHGAPDDAKPKVSFNVTPRSGGSSGFGWDKKLSSPDLTITGATVESAAHTWKTAVCSASLEKGKGKWSIDLVKWNGDGRKRSIAIGFIEKTSKFNATKGQSVGNTAGSHGWELGKNMTWTSGKKLGAGAVRANANGTIHFEYDISIGTMKITYNGTIVANMNFTPNVAIRPAVSFSGPFAVKITKG